MLYSGFFMYFKSTVCCKYNTKIELGAATLIRHKKSVPHLRYTSFVVFFLLRKVIIFES